MSKFLQILGEGLATGSLYALIALGYTMVYGVLQFINFAHGSIFMVGAWFSFLVARWTGWGGDDPARRPWVALPAILFTVMAACAALGLTIERLAYRPLRRSARLNLLITTIGVALLLENVGQLHWVFGAQPQRMPALLSDTALFHLGGASVQRVDAIICGLMLALMGALEWLVYHTRTGRAMRAVAQNPDVAALMGVSVDRVVVLTFGIGSALAGAAGFFYTLKYPGLNQPAHATWVLLGLKAFVAAVVGGIGNIRGAVLGGLIIGLVELFGAAYLSPNLRDVYVFSLLIVILLVRPTGLLGTGQVEKL